jgi:hypothetical protein
MVEQQSGDSDETTRIVADRREEAASVEQEPNLCRETLLPN